MADDNLMLTIRLYDPLEKTDADKSASWAVVSVARADLDLTHDFKLADFAAKYLVPNIGKLKQLKLS